MTMRLFVGSKSVMVRGVDSASRPLSTRPSNGNGVIALKLRANDAAGIDDVCQQHVQPHPFGVAQVGPIAVPSPKN